MNTARALASNPSHRVRRQMISSDVPMNWSAPGSRLIIPFLLALSLSPLGARTHPARAEPVSIPLQHLKSDNDQNGFDMLGITVAINGGKPRLYKFDTGSDSFQTQIDASIPGVEPVPGTKPEMYAYGDGTYGHWMQKIQFESLSYFDPDAPAKPVVTLDGGYIGGQVIDAVYTADHASLKDRHISQKPVGYYNGKALYADLDIRRRIRNGEPGRHPPTYGIFAAGDFLGEEVESSALGGRTQSGYVIAANANVGDRATPGCAPCLTLHLTPSIRSQFTALMPWGHLEYDGDRKIFPVSGASASLQFEGLYNYTLSVPVGGKKRAVQFKSPILFDSGSDTFVVVTADSTLKKLRSSGFKLADAETRNVDFKLGGFKDKKNDMEFDDVEIFRLDDDENEKGITLGVPFFHLNSVMYDLENRVTAYSPYYVSTDSFTTDVTGEGKARLNRVTTDMGSSGWLGLAGNLSGSGDFTVEKDTVVRLTGVNTYAGRTRIAPEGMLYLAGPGSIAHSAAIVVDGVFNIDQKGSYEKAWGVPDTASEVVIRNLNGSGTVELGARTLVITAGEGEFRGVIDDYGDEGGDMAGGLVLRGGKLTLSGETDYTGLTEVAASAELHVSGHLSGDVSVSGRLVVDGEIAGKVMVEKGGVVLGKGKVGSVAVAEGGRATLGREVKAD